MQLLSSASALPLLILRPPQTAPSARPAAFGEAVPRSPSAGDLHGLRREIVPKRVETPPLADYPGGWTNVSAPNTPAKSACGSDWEHLSQYSASSEDGCRYPAAMKYVLVSG